jgi:hypothetical protein
MSGGAFAETENGNLERFVETTNRKVERMIESNQLGVKLESARNWTNG